MDEKKYEYKIIKYTSKLNNSNDKIYMNKIKYYNEKLGGVRSRSLARFDDYSLSDDDEPLFSNTQMNGILNNLHDQVTIIESSLSTLVDKIFPTAISHTNYNYSKPKYRQNPDFPDAKLVITGGKSANFYTHIFDFKPNFKSFDYDISILGSKNNNKTLTATQVNKELCSMANDIFKNSRPLLSVIYNQCIKEANNQSQIFEFLPIDQFTNPDTFLPFVYKRGNTRNQSHKLFGRAGNSVYIIVAYKFKTLNFLTNNQSNQKITSVNKQNIISQYSNKNEIIPNTINLEDVYYSGLGVTDVHSDESFPYFANFSKDALYKKFNLKKSITSVKIREFTHGIYSSNIRNIPRTLYFPRLDVVIINFFYMSHINTQNGEYAKKDKNRKKYEYLIKLINDNQEKIDKTMFSNMKNYRQYFNNVNWKYYMDLFKNAKSGNYVDNNVNMDKLRFILISLSKFYDTISTMPLNILLQPLPLINSSFDHTKINSSYLRYNYCDIESNSNVDKLLNAFTSKNDERIIGDNNYSKIVKRYVNNSSEINVGLINNNLVNVLSKYDNITTIGQYAQSLDNVMMETHTSLNSVKNKYNKDTHFFVYNSSKVYNKSVRPNTTEKSFFQIGQTYKLPNYMSTSYSKCSPDSKLFIGYEYQPFLFRIMIPVHSNNYMTIKDTYDNQFELIIKRGSLLKITSVSRSFMKINNDLIINCLLIDCYLMDENIDIDTSIMNMDHFEQNNVQIGGAIETNAYEQPTMLFDKMHSDINIQSQYKKLQNPFEYSIDIKQSNINKPSVLNILEQEPNMMEKYVKNQPNIIIPSDVNADDTASIIMKYYN